MRKKRNRSVRSLLLTPLLIILFSGCDSILNFGFDYFELGHFHKNGSGKFEIIFSMDRSQRLIALGERMIPDHIEVVRLFLDDAYAEAAKRLASVPGISQIAHHYDKNNSHLHFGLSFHFNSIAALNKAMTQIDQEDPRGITYFQFNDRKFVRTYVANKVGKLLEIYRQNDDSWTKSFDLNFFFRNMRYVIQYSFPHEIKKVNTPLATIPENRKRVTIIGNMVDASDKATPSTQGKNTLTSVQVLFTNSTLAPTSSTAQHKDNKRSR